MKDGILITVFILCAIYTVFLVMFLVKNPDAFNCTDEVICTEI